MHINLAQQEIITRVSEVENKCPPIMVHARGGQSGLVKTARNNMPTML